MRLLIDQNVPDSVARFLAERGHEVQLVRNALGRASPDQVIALTAAFEGIVVVTFDKDFRRFQQLLPEGQRTAFAAGAGFIHLAMKEPRGVARLRDEIETIELYASRAERDSKHVRIRLTETTIQLGLSGGRIQRRAQYLDRCIRARRPSSVTRAFRGESASAQGLHVLHGVRPWKPTTFLGAQPISSFTSVEQNLM